MIKVSKTKTIELPRRVIDSMMEVYEKWEEFRDELEDFSLSTDHEFIKKMRKARKEEMSGKTRNLAELKREL